MTQLPLFDNITEDAAADTLRAAGWTLHRPGQSCVGNSHAYAGKRDTSRSAALENLPRTGTQRRRVLDALRTVGSLTDVQLQQHLDMRPNTERPRRVELVDGGFVRDSGRRRRHNGREHVVWEAV